MGRHAEYLIVWQSVSYSNNMNLIQLFLNYLNHFRREWCWMTQTGMKHHCGNRCIMHLLAKYVRNWWKNASESTLHVWVCVCVCVAYLFCGHLCVSIIYTVKSQIIAKLNWEMCSKTNPHSWQKSLVYISCHRWPYLVKHPYGEIKSHGSNHNVPPIIICYRS